ncbi:MAG: hypothetical protein IPM81_00800 [Saprospirales bacterium]|jgi:hypothetical protein|nr:hypothetical protein [Saprospirales bacterium]
MKTILPQGLFIAILLLQTTGILAGQSPVDAQTSVFEYLTQEEASKLMLEINLEKLLKNRKNGEYQKAVLTDASGRQFPVEVRTRGKFRRKRCEIPPVKLKFAKDSLLAFQLDTMNEIKLVLPCTADPGSDELIVREYVAYRMFEILSPECSARARLIRLQLKGKEKKRAQKMLAMFVEHEEEISARQRCSIVKEWGVRPEQMNMDQVALMVLFQYMIGNMDWDISASRNVLLLQPHSDGKIIPVPFDFDFSGLVSAPYSSPSQESGMLTVRDRYLMADGIDTEALQRAKQKILAAKQELYKWCRFNQLSSAASDDMTHFMDTFFDMLAKSDEIPAKLEISKQ